MKVTFLTGEYPPMQGGIADYTAHLAQHLLTHGIKPAVLINDKYPDKTRCQRDSDETASIPVHAILRGWGWRCWPKIKQFLIKHPTDVLHIQYQAAAFDLGGWVNWLPWRLQRWPDRPRIVTTFHDLRIPYIFPKAGRFRWQSMLALARHSDAVICTNHEDAETLRQHVWANHIYEIPLGNNIDVNPPPSYDRQAWRAQLGFSDNTVVITYFGFLNESKGGEDLIDTLALLIQRGIDARLLMIGGDIGDSDPTNRDYAVRIRTMIREHNLNEGIIFTGYVSPSDVSAHLLAADMAVMPYRDGVSFRRTTLVAALQHGLPIISTTPTLANPHIIDGENMLLVSSGGIEALSDAVLRVVKDDALRDQLAVGASDLGQRFDWEHIAAETAQLYHHT